MTLVPTVFIVDNDETIRKSLKMLAASMQLDAVDFASAREFLDAYDRALPGCLVLAVRLLGGMSGLQLQEKLVADGFDIPIVFISAYGDVSTCVKAMKLGAVTFLEKPLHPGDLRHGVTEAIQLDANRRQARDRRSEMMAKIARLTRKEREVMDHIVAGKADKKIATELDVSLRTVQFRKASILKKTGVESWAALVELVLVVRNPLKEGLY